MVKITIKYDRKDFFGGRIYTEDTVTSKDAETAVKMANKAFKLVLADDAAIEVTNPDGETIIVMQDYSNRENGVVTVRIYYSAQEYDILSMSVSKARGLVRAMCKGSYIGIKED